MKRGYACIALDNPKNSINIGSALRACGVYGAAMLITSGCRYRKVPTDTMCAVKHMPLIQVEDVFDAIPYDCVPVAVDLVEGATPLPEYKHPERAFYIFGGEDATLGERILSRCRDTIMIPTNGCMNLAATVNVVLYDRLTKG
jgi:tRNA(Leu) C34 or U34 (ribose-2'-O)-methylase TrmL